MVDFLSLHHHTWLLISTSAKGTSGFYIISDLMKSISLQLTFNSISLKLTFDLYMNTADIWSRYHQSLLVVSKSCGDFTMSVSLLLTFELRITAHPKTFKLWHHNSLLLISISLLLILELDITTAKFWIDITTVDFWSLHHCSWLLILILAKRTSGFYMISDLMKSISLQLTFDSISLRMTFDLYNTTADFWYWYWQSALLVSI